MSLAAPRAIDATPIKHQSSESRRVSWWRIACNVVVGVILLGVAAVAVKTILDQPAADFHVGIWRAGQSVLDGRSPYPAATPTVLLHIVHGFIAPPLLAIVAAPFSTLPFHAALVLWDVLSVAALVLSLWLLDVRDLRIYGVMLVSLPMADALANGQPDAFLALLACLTWRYRDSLHGAVAAGALIAAKLLAWPLLIWMLVTRRTRSLIAATGTAVGLLIASWAAIGFKGFLDYPRLLSADARAFEAWPWSYSLVHALTPLGLGLAGTRLLAAATAISVAAVVLVLARGRDSGWFAAALTFGLLSSPILWPHYLLVLFVPLAITRGWSVRTWTTMAIGSWFPMLIAGPGVERTVFVLVLTAAVAVWAVRGVRPPGSVRVSRMAAVR